MGSYDGTELLLIVNLFEISEKLESVDTCALQRPRASAATVAPALHTRSNRNIAIFINAAIIYQRLITYNMHRTEPASI